MPRPARSSSKRSTRKSVAVSSSDAVPAAPADASVALEQVITWLLTGETEHAVRAAIQGKFPNQDPATLLNEAARYLAAVGGADPAGELEPTDVKRGFCLLAYKELYRKALAAADYDTALKALKALQSVR